MATHTLTAATNEATVATRESIYTSVERFALTPARPEGINGIIAVDPETGDWQPVLSREAVPRGLRLAPRARRLAFSDGGEEGRLWIIEYPWDAAPELVARLIGHASFAISASGEEFFVSFRGPIAGSAGHAGVWRLAKDGSEWVRLPLPEGESVHDCSPDGKWLLVGEGRIKLVSPDGSERRDLTPRDEKCIRPRFSPDGQQVVYASSTHDGESLWVADIQGRGRRLLVPESRVTIVACWSPDGSRLALKLCDCVPGPEGWMIVPKELSIMRPRIEIVDVEGGDRRSLDLPAGRILLGGWG